MKQFFPLAVLLLLLPLLTPRLSAQTYVGSTQCKTCHDNVNSNTGYNIWEEYTKSGHPYKLNPVNGGPPVYPPNTSAGVPNPPPGTSWDDYAMVIGGYGWKARFIKKDGLVFTATTEVQYNLSTQGWVAYHLGEDVPYNEACFQCHTTGNDPSGSWVPGTPGLGTFSEPGVRCEGCHGPGSDHVADPTGIKLPNQGDDLTHNRCGECHQRGGITNNIPASGLYIKHHEQFNEMQAAKHGAVLKCGTCHDTHIAGRYPGAAGAGLKAITKECSTCHPDHQITVNGKDKSIDCIDCHMAMASKSAVGTQVGNGWKGDVKTHIFAINTAAVTREEMFTADGGAVKLDADGLASVTLDFACLGCHQSKDVSWAAGYAKGIHENGIVTLPDYVGSQQCKACHDNVNSNTGYNIWEEYTKSGHPYKLNPVNGGPPVYPPNTSAGVPNPPAGTTWDDYAMVIGGYGWKARFIKKDGKIYTETENAQYNLSTQGWVAYHLGEDKAYDEACFQCHTTGNDPEGSWVPGTPGLGTFSEPGVRCEGCHGPGGDHVTNPTGVKLPNQGEDLTHNRCGECHQRGGITNNIPASGLYIKHHEQFNEMQAAKHGAVLKCGTCHDTHIPGRYPDAAGAGLKAITKECSTCHADHDITVNGQPKSIDCIDCHMSMASKSAVGTQVGNGWKGDVKTHIFAINTDAVTREEMFTADGAAVKLDADGLASVTLDFACLGCHQSKDVSWAAGYAKGIHENGIVVLPDYVGSQQCKTCHDNVNSNTGYNIWEEYTKSGHPYKLNPVNGGPPVYPPNTSAGVPNPPPGTSWDDYAMVIGGYGWKARFIKKDGFVFTDTEEVQYNLSTQGWVAYHFGEDVPYNEGCFQCHTTGNDPSGSWVPGTPGLGTFSEPGVRCEGCHGPGGDHVTNPTGVKLPNQGVDLTHNRCGECHQRGGITNNIPASGGYIKHHEQFNEMQAAKHGAVLKCGTCHDTHIAGRYPDAAGDGLKAITKECSTCHPDHEMTVDGNPKSITCIDCHMSMASKSAVGTQLGNGWKGDVKTHIFAINTDAVTKDAMFTADGGAVKLDDDGMAAVTLDFACLGCHQSKDVAWAATYAEDIHEDGIVTSMHDPSGLPTVYVLEQNYPNPFNPTTTITYSVPAQSRVKIEVLDAFGRVVATLTDAEHNPGSHTIAFDGEHIASGIYYYRLTAGATVMARKMLLMK